MLCISYGLSFWESMKRVIVYYICQEYQFPLFRWFNNLFGGFRVFLRFLTSTLLSPANPRIPIQNLRNQIPPINHTNDHIESVPEPAVVGQSNLIGRVFRLQLVRVVTNQMNRMTTTLIGIGPWDAL